MIIARKGRSCVWAVSLFFVKEKEGEDGGKHNWKLKGSFSGLVFESERKHLKNPRQRGDLLLALHARRGKAPGHKLSNTTT